MSTTVICIRGSSCLMKGVRANLYLIGLSLLVVISIVVTNRGQKAAGLVARLFFKSTKIIPTVIFESLLIKSFPSPARLTGCLILTLGCFSYFKSTSMTHSSSLEESPPNYALGVTYLLIGAIIDSTLTVIEKVMFFKPDAMCALTSTQLAFGCAWWGLLTFSIGSALGLLDMDFEHALTLGMQVYRDLILFCMCSATAYFLNFFFIETYGSVYADCFKLFRKMISMVAFGVIDGVTLTRLSVLSISFCSMGLWLIESRS